MKRPDLWERFVRSFVKSDIDAQEKRTEDVVAHADEVREAADRMLTSETDRRLRHDYAAAEARFRREPR
jgi:hypothetical protein